MLPLFASPSIDPSNRGYPEGISNLDFLPAQDKGVVQVLLLIPGTSEGIALKI